MTGNLLHVFSNCAELVLAPDMAVEVEVELEVGLLDVEVLEGELALEFCVDDALEELEEAGEVSEVPDLLEPVFKLQTGFPSC